VHTPDYILLQAVHQSHSAIYWFLVGLFCPLLRTQCSEFWWRWLLFLFWAQGRLLG